MTQNETRLSKHYAGKIFLALILMKIGAAGAVSAMTLNFVAPIVKELGSEVSAFTMMISINAIAMAMLYTTASRFLIQKRMGLVMGFASLVEVIGLALMSTYTSVHMFYFSGALIGGAQAFTGFVAIPIVVNMWFKKRTGSVLGFIVAIGSGATILYGLLSAQLITSLGWRAAYLVLAGMALVITVPAVFLLVKSPAEAGSSPFGEEAARLTPGLAQPVASEWSLDKEKAFRMPLLYLAWLTCILYSIGSGVTGYLTPFATLELGMTINQGALVGMLLSLGSILASLILGRINDHHGPRAGMLWGSAATTLGFVLIFLSYRYTGMVYPSAFIVGLGGMSMYTVQSPLLVRNVVGGRDYSRIWATMMIGNSLIGGGLYSSIGLFYDKLGSFRGAFFLIILLFNLALLTGSIALNKGKEYREANPTG